MVRVVYSQLLPCNNVVHKGVESNHVEGRGRSLFRAGLARLRETMLTGRLWVFLSKNFILQEVLTPVERYSYAPARNGTNSLNNEDF